MPQKVFPIFDNVLMSNALSFYRSKIILDRPNNFDRLLIVLDWPNLFLSGPNHFGQVQIINVSPEKSNLNLTKIIWTQPKQFGWSKIILDRNLLGFLGGEVLRCPCSFLTDDLDGSDEVPI